MSQKSYYQYRVTVNGAQSKIYDSLPHKVWDVSCQASEWRGYDCKLERRLICSADIIHMLTDPTGYIKLDDDTVVCPWEILAECEYS